MKTIFVSLLLMLIGLTIISGYPTTGQSPYEFAITLPSPDGSMVAGVASNGLFRIWDSVTGNVLIDIPTQLGFLPALDMVWSPDSTRIATVGGDMVAQIWCVDFTVTPTCTLGDLIDEIEGHDDPLISIAWSGTEQIATGGQGEGYNVRIWDAANNYQNLHSILGPYSNELEWNSSNGLLYSASEWGGVSVIDTVLESFTHLGPDIPALSMAISPDEESIAVGTDIILDTGQANIYLLDIDDGSVISVLTGHTDRITALAWSPDGDFVASVSRDGTLRIWDLEAEDSVIISIDKSIVATVGIGWTATTGLVFPVENGMIRGIGSNLAPQANAGGDQEIYDIDGNGLESVILDANSSQDDVSIVRYAWFEGETLIGTGINPTISLSVGTHHVTLQVMDDDGLIASDVVVITILDS